MNTKPIRVLLIKLSSMGDVIHTLPALTDAASAIPNIQFDWVVEKAFAQIPTWHKHVQNIIPVALRQWRGELISAFKNKQPQTFFNALRKTQYDYVIDAQGLIKSALITRLAHGLRVGFAKNVARESLASYFYQQQYYVDRNQHALTRTRELFAKVLGYQCPTTIANYQIDPQRLTPTTLPITENYLVFLHGTTWSSKYWPESYWHTLIANLASSGKQILLPWGNDNEHHRALRFAKKYSHAHVLPKLNLAELATVIIKANAVVAVDTGLGHLSAALNVPTISLYGPTNPKLTGTIGLNQYHLQANFSCAPCLQKQCTYLQSAAVTPACFTTVAPEQVNHLLNKILKQ